MNVCKSDKKRTCPSVFLLFVIYKTVTKDDKKATVSLVYNNRYCVMRKLQTYIGHSHFFQFW